MHSLKKIKITVVLGLALAFLGQTVLVFANNTATDKNSSVLWGQTFAELQAETLAVELDPSPNSHTAPRTTNITATFTAAINPETISEATFVVHSRFQGQVTGTYYPSNNEVVFDPSLVFFPGELLQTTLTTDIIAGDSSLPDPFVGQFRTAASEGSGQFHDSGQRLGLWKTWEVALGDIDNDGDLDAITANYRSQSNRVYLNNNGTLSDMGIGLDGSISTEDVALGDLNGDGYLDVVFANISYSNHVWLNNGEWDLGTGRFVDTGQSLVPGYGNQAIDLGDLDGDGDLDVFVANSSFPSTVLFNDGTGFFTSSGEEYSNGGDVKLGDLDGDNDLDAVIVGLPNVIWFNAGGLQGGTPGNFTLGQAFGNNVGSGFASLGDLDNDGDLDILLGNMDKAPNEVWFNQGGRQGGTLGLFDDSEQRMGAGTSEGAYLGDLDGDGDLDAFFTNGDYDDGGVPNEIWINNDGLGTFSLSQLQGNSDSLAAALGDINEDGALDIFVANGHDAGGEANEIWLNRKINNDFVITVKTDNPGTSTDTQFTIPTYSEETYNYNVDCNSDGIDEATSVNGDYTCSYEAAATYTISIADNTGTNTGFPRIYFNNTGDKDKLLSIEQWGENNWASMASAFYGCSNLAGQAGDSPDLSNVADMSWMFANATAFNQDISGWNTTNVTDMNHLFSNAATFNKNIGNWDVSNVTDMSWLFAGASTFNQNMVSWNVENVTKMNNMFSYALDFNQDIGSWKVLNVTDMSAMFFFAPAFNQDIGNWNVANVTDMSKMFLLAPAFNQDISQWNTGNVMDMSEMFKDAYSFDQNLGNWDVSSLISADLMFDGTYLSTANYDALLIGWSDQSLHSGVSFSGGSSTYCKEDAVSAKEKLLNTYGWTITDGGNVCPDFCSVVTTITPGELFTDQLGASTDVKAYTFEVNNPYSTIIATLTPPASGDFDLSLFKSCDDSTGYPWDIGRRAWHIGRRAWHIGGEEDPNIYVNYNVGEATGTYYLAVQVPADGEYSSEEYQLRVELRDPEFTIADTLIIFNRERYLDAYGLDATSQMMDMLVQLSEHEKVNGLILQLDQFQNVTDAYELWDNADVIDGEVDSYKTNVQEANSVAIEIRNAMVDFLLERNARLTKYVILIGGDNQIPFRRMEIVPDKIEGDDHWKAESEYLLETLIEEDVNSSLEAALMLDRTLTDDHYSDYQDRPYQNFWPFFSVGRLIETPEQIEKAIEAFFENDGKIIFSPGVATAAVAGYDFLEDSAQALCNRLDVQDWGTLDCILDPPRFFSSTDLYQKFTAADFAAHYGHSNHGQLFTPDETYLGADQIASTEINGTLWWALGCHSGLSLPDSENYALSLAEALSVQGVTYVGNTGWAWGAGPITHSELLYDLLAAEVSGHDSIAIGEALRQAKIAYYAQTINNAYGIHIFDYYDAKVLAEATLYGLPMLEFDFPNTINALSTQSINTANANSTATILEEVNGLAVPVALNTLTIIPGELDHTFQVYEDNNYYLGRDGAYGALQGKPSIPIVEEINFNTTLGKARGVLWLTGTFEIVRDINPIIIQPVQLNGAPGIEPTFQGTYPLFPVTLISLEDLYGAYTDRLTFYTGQYTGDQDNGIMRLFNSMEFFVGTWDSEPVDENAPVLGTQTAQLSEGVLQVTLPIDDESGVYKAYLTYTEKNAAGNIGSWQSIQMLSETGQCVPGQQEYQVSLAIDTEIEYFLQVMDCEGNVAYLFNGENYFLANPEAPINDDFDNALDLIDIAPSHYLSTHGATSNIDDPLVSNCGLGAEAATVWYKYTHTGPTSAIAIDTKGADYDTFIAVWTGSRTNLSPVICNDNVDGTQQSAIAFQVHEGVTYYIEVGQKTGSESTENKDGSKLYK